MEMLSADREESLLRGYIPLDSAKLNEINAGKKVGSIIFDGNGYFNDCYLHLLKRSITNADVFSDLQTVNLIGCSYISDYGIRSLVAALKSSTKLKEIQLGGCASLTDNSYALLLDTVLKSVQTSCGMQSTSVSYLNNVAARINTAGSPAISHTLGEGSASEESLHGRLLIVPHPSLNLSLGELLHTGKLVERKKGYHCIDGTIKDQPVTITEIHPTCCLYEDIANSSPTQVIIPFDSSLEPKDIKKHVMSTMATIVAKEPVWCKYPDIKPLAFKTEMSNVAFLDFHLLDKLAMKVEEGSNRAVLTNVSTKESSIGAYVSQTPLTRSNPYYEVETGELNVTGKPKCAILIGCMFDLLFHLRHPMDSNAESGGYVDGFELQSNMKIGFGIEGEWVSEYTPAPGSKFFFVEGGEKKAGKDETMTDAPHTGMYPLVSVLGEEIFSLKLPPLVTPPTKLQDLWKKENRWVETGYISNCLIDNHGVMRFVSNYQKSALEAIFVGRYEFAGANSMFSITVNKLAVNTGKFSDFMMGAAAETYTEKINTQKHIQHALIGVKIEPFFKNWTCDSCREETDVNRTSCGNLKCTNKGKRPENYTAWECTECHFPNDALFDKCSSCKKGTKPEGFGELKYTITTTTNTPQPVTDLKIKEGDVISVNVDDKIDGVNIVKFLVNGKEIARRNLQFAPQHTCRLVPYVRLKTGCTDVLTINNYRPTYRRPAPIPSKITVGQAHFVDVMDDGVVKFSMGGCKTTQKLYGSFMAKTPFNRDMLQFEVEVLDLPSSGLFGIAGVHPGYNAGSFVGWHQGTIAYHGDNGKLYDNTSQGSAKWLKVDDDDSIKVSVGCVMGLKVCPLNDKVPLKFDSMGHLDSQQTVKLHFTKDGRLIHEIEYEILTSFHPGFSIKDATVKIHNFYAETQELWEEIQQRENNTKDFAVKKKLQTKESSVETFNGTEFLLVSMATSRSDPRGKMELLKQHLDLTQWDEMKQVSDAIQEREKILSKLDQEDQQQLARLYSTEDNMMLLTNNPSRIKYLSVSDDNTTADISHMAEEIRSSQARFRKLQSQRFKLPKKTVDLANKIAAELDKCKVIRESEIFTKIPALKEFDGLKVNALLKDMQCKGRLLLLKMCSGNMIADIQFLMDVEEKLLELIPTEMMQTGAMVTSIGSTSHIWDGAGLERLLAWVPQSQTDEIQELMEKLFSLIRLPCLRTKSSECQDIRVIQGNISNPPVPMVDYWSATDDTSEFIVIKRTYSFLSSTVDHMLSSFISNTCKYGRIVILTGEGVVYNNGAVQTIIVKHKDEADKDVVIIESRCYMPEISDEQSSMSKLTPSYVQDYTWNIFCIYTDVIDDFLARSNTVYMVTKDRDSDLVNVSVGCKHSWVHHGGKVRQSICTLCNRCCDKGENCPWNSIMGEHLRECTCKTEMVCCKNCGICMRCAEELWGIRSRLRPLAATTTLISQLITQKTNKKTEEGDRDREVYRDPVKLPLIPLDPFLYNEMVFTNLSNDSKILCLREESDGTLIQVYPDQPTYVPDMSKIVMTKQKVEIGDKITVRISDPLGVSCQSSLEQGETNKEDVPILIEPQYFAHVGREVKVIHESGILVYDTNSSSIPVGQFISGRPMTKDNNNFSVRVLSTGEKATIALGLVPKNYPPNRQPGWNAQSIAYHADDGGVFLESGWPTRKTKPCKVGDIMSLYIDFDKNKGFFRKNGEKMIELNLNPSRLAFYPCIGFHSIGEAVQILEKDLWTPLKEEERNLDTPAYTTYKYGNLWISPGKKVTLTNLGGFYNGWVVLHNPKRDSVGYKVTTGYKEEDVFYGILEHKKDWLHHFKLKKERLPEDIIVEWSSLESGRTYTIDDIKLLLGPIGEQTQQSSHRHRLLVSVIDSFTSSEVLPTVASGPPPEKSMLKLQLFRNDSLDNEYWLKYGSWHMSVESNSMLSKFVLKYPKCPSYTYSKRFQKGMKLALFLESLHTYAECIVVDIYSRGRMLALEYSPKDKSDNMTICVMANSPALKFTEFNDDESALLPYEARNTPSNLTRTFVTAPPYMLSEGGVKVLNFVDKEWKSNVLRSVSQCSQVFTRFTVQENQICKVSRKLLEWIKTDSSNYMYVFLPDKLSVSSLMYPQGTTMFTDIGVHRMCYAGSELTMQAALEEDVVWKMPLHFVDIPGMTPDRPIPVSSTFGDAFNAWTYAALISSRLFLPSYKNIIPDADGQLSRPQVEQLLYNILQSYVALCSIYSAPWGGVEYAKISEENDVRKAIGHDDFNLIKYSGKPHTETDKLMRYGGFATCKAHCLNLGVSDITFSETVDFDYAYFEPYTEVVNMFHWRQTGFKGLPDDFFEKFPNLQYFAIGMPDSKMVNFKSLPKGIGKSTSLKVIEITNTAMTSLPDDIFMCESTVTVALTNMPIKQLPSQWSEKSQIDELILAGLQVEVLPEGIGNLCDLQHLELCYLPLKDLPEKMSNLKKLKILMVKGAPWFFLEGKRSQVTHDQFLAWHNTNPFIKYHLGETTVEKMFEEYDYNHNGSLDEEELSHVNVKLFFDYPRLGLADLNDEVTGGIPTVIFSLKSLTELYLDNNAITMVPQAINNLQNLSTLSLHHNPLLESLPGSLGHLPNIKGINILSCPMLRTPPNEVVGRGFESVKAYLKRLAGGFTECRRTKLMVVGLGGAGKTSLLRALMSDKKITSGTEKEIPTDGIDIVPWTIASEDGKEVTYSTWDFAGQAVYYNTHQFFLSKRAVYLLLWSMRQGYEHAGLDFWLSSICCHAPGTPILVIGTQCDLIPKAEIPEKELKERYPQIAGFHRVSAIKGIGIQELQKDLLDVTLQQGYMGEKIPQVWLNFEKRIMAERLTKKSYLKWDVARQYAMEQGIYDEKDVRLAIQLLHDLGTVQYFDNDFLRDYVVINPQWIVNVMACVVSAQDSPIQKNKGRFLHADIPTVWNDYESSLHEWLLRLTEDFDLTFPLPKEPVNVVPCLLPGEPPDDLKWPSVREQKGIRETKMVYRFTYLPSGLFNRAQVRLFQFSDGKQVWKKGSLLSKNRHLALIKQSDNSELVVLVQGPRPENILFLIHEVFESIIEESFNGVSYDLLIPCPDCIMKEGTFDPYLLNATLVRRAKDLKAPFLQCYKFFHWISMSQLQEKMPADSREVADFDIQLQQSIVALEELNQDLMTDTAIIYSSSDIPAAGDTEGIPPKLIYDDIRSWGHTCWFADDMDQISYVDLTTAIKSCRVLLALVSDNFERDAKCRDMFLYARETMNKDIIIVVLGTSLEWQNKDLGMKIGNQERKLMAKTLPRYTIEDGRRDELKAWLGEKLYMQKKVDDILPDVFLSYNWSNSLNASEISGRKQPGAIGWGDPRQLKAILDKEGINCWIDIENVGKEKKGIFADMAAGIRNSKIMVACISDEYAESDNCMMELRFGILNMQLPLVVIVVGTGTQWKETEVAMLLRRSKAPEVFMQNENPEGFKAMVKFVKDAISKADLTSKERVKAKDLLKMDKKAEKNEEKATKKSSSIAYQEEYELIQRKFMRHILGAVVSSSLGTVNLPRLIVVDFVKSAQGQSTNDGRESSEGHNKRPSSRKFVLRPKSAARSRDRLQVDADLLDDDDADDWSKESFCMRLLCENEEGWHLCKEMFPLAFRSRENLEVFLKKSAPYLHRIYTILKQSPIKLKCFSGRKGDTYLKWIRDESDENLDFVGAMEHLQEEFLNDDAHDFNKCLARCRLPSGKIVWLCNTHQQGQHVSKLSINSSGGTHNLQRVLFTEDKLLMEQMEKSAAYKKLKGIKSSKVAPKLPAPIPIPIFVPKVEEQKTDEESSKKADETPRKADELAKKTDDPVKKADEATKKVQEETKKADEKKPVPDKKEPSVPTPGPTPAPKQVEDTKTDTQNNDKQKIETNVPKEDEKKQSSENKTEEDQEPAQKVTVTNKEKSSKVLFQEKKTETGSKSIQKAEAIPESDETDNKTKDVADKEQKSSIVADIKRKAEASRKSNVNDSGNKVRQTVHNTKTFKRSPSKKVFDTKPEEEPKDPKRPNFQNGKGLVRGSTVRKIQVNPNPSTVRSGPTTGQPDMFTSSLLINSVKKDGTEGPLVKDGGSKSSSSRTDRSGSSLVLSKTTESKPTQRPTQGGAKSKSLNTPSAVSPDSSQGSRRSARSKPGGATRKEYPTSKACVLQ